MQQTRDQTERNTSDNEIAVVCVCVLCVCVGVVCVGTCCCLFVVCGGCCGIVFVVSVADYVMLLHVCC